MAAIKQTSRGTSLRKLVTILNAQYHALASARGNEALLRDYASLIGFIRSANEQELERIFGRQIVSSSPERAPQYSDVELADLSLEEVERSLQNETIPRKQLERIAIHRFRVPRGSMRSFSNRRQLVRKLLTLVRNEQAHATIDMVARGQSGHKSDG